MKIQREEFEKFGIMADWTKESTYRTLGNYFFGGITNSFVTECLLDHQYEMRQLRIFQQMVSKGSFPCAV
jgi:isoleucyl-tRNA synthetase